MKLPICSVLLALFCAATPHARAQSAPVSVLPLQPYILSESSSISAADLPDAPSPSLQQAANANVPPAAASPAQTKRILGIIPNFRSVSADVILPPDTPKDKLLTGIEDSFDYSSFVFVGIQAGIYMTSNSTPQFHQTPVSYGRYYWHTFVDNADEDLWVESFMPIALHQDSRYYTLGHGGVLKRSAYALSRTLITRTDSGQPTFNSSEIFGAGAASGISSLYYPTANRSFTTIGQLWLTNVLIDGGTFVFKEFWPDINANIFHQVN